MDIRKRRSAPIRCRNGHCPKANLQRCHRVAPDLEEIVVALDIRIAKYQTPPIKHGIANVEGRISRPIVKHIENRTAIQFAIGVCRKAFDERESRWNHCCRQYHLQVLANALAFDRLRDDDGCKQLRAPRRASRNDCNCRNGFMRSDRGLDLGRLNAVSEYLDLIICPPDLLRLLRQYAFALSRRCDTISQHCLRHPVRE